MTNRERNTALCAGKQEVFLCLGLTGLSLVHFQNWPHGVAGTAGREDKLFWVHDFVLCMAECEPQPGAGQAGSVHTAFV